MIGCGGDSNFAGDGKTILFQSEIDAAMAIEDLLFYGGAETEVFGFLLKPLLDGLMLGSASAQVGGWRNVSKDNFGIWSGVTGSSAEEGKRWEGGLRPPAAAASGPGPSPSRLALLPSR